MSRGVITAYAHSNVSKAVKLMADHEIGSVVVVDDSGPVGIFSERDLLSKVLAEKRKLEEPILMEVMTSSFNVIYQDQTLADAAKTMTSKKGRLIVFDDGVLTGLVTATDIIKEIHKSGSTFDISNVITRRIFEVGPETTLELVVQLMDKKRIGSVLVFERKIPKGVFTERDLLKRIAGSNPKLSTRVGECATRPVMTAEEGIDGREAIGIMLRNRIKRLPITKSGEIVGIVTARDLVAGFAKSV